MMLGKEKDVVEIRDEVDKYLLEASEDPANPKFNVLDWWKENCPRYPILSKIARDVFAVPASTVASESAFSLGKRVVDPFRSSLTPQMVECLVCMSDWLRAAGFSMYKEPTKAEMELYSELHKLESGNIFIICIVYFFFFPWFKFVNNIWTNFGLIMNFW